MSSGMHDEGLSSFARHSHTQSAQELRLLRQSGETMQNGGSSNGLTNQNGGSSNGLTNDRRQSNCESECDVTHGNCHNMSAIHPSLHCEFLPVLPSVHFIVCYVVIFCPCQPCHLPL